MTQLTVAPVPAPCAGVGFMSPFVRRCGEICPRVRLACPSVRLTEELREDRCAFGRAARGPADRRGVLRFRAERAVGGRGAAVAGDRRHGDARGAARHRVPRDRARGVLGTRDRRRAGAAARRGSDRVPPGRCPRAVERAGHAGGARHGDVRPSDHAVAVDVRDRRRRRARADRLRLPGLRRASLQPAAGGAAAR